MNLLEESEENLYADHTELHKKLLESGGFGLSRVKTEGVPGL